MATSGAANASHNGPRSHDNVSHVGEESAYDLRAKVMVSKNLALVSILKNVICISGWGNT
jgi:hypothetical protein